jgi:hypothetical protein
VDASLACRTGAAAAGACIGTFVLAEPGLLDNHDATTTWWLAPLFRQRDPRVRLDESRMIVKSGKLVTAGVALSHMDLAFWIIRHKSLRLAAFLRKSTGRRRLPSQRFNSVEGLVFAFNSTLSALAGAISFPDDYRGRGFSSDNMSGFAVRRHWR